MPDGLSKGVVKMLPTTLVFPVLGDSIERILLGYKKTGFGKGKWNGFGGKIQPDETVSSAALRELQEESGLLADEKDLIWVGRLEFVFPASPELDHPVEIFLIKKWQNTPIETDEMCPKWFSTKDVPYHSMWDDDIFWFPQVLRGEKICGEIVFDSNNEKVASHQIKSFE